MSCSYVKGLLWFLTKAPKKHNFVAFTSYIDFCKNMLQFLRYLVKSVSMWKSVVPLYCGYYIVGNWLSAFRIFTVYGKFGYRYHKSYGSFHLENIVRWPPKMVGYCIISKCNQMQASAFSGHNCDLESSSKIRKRFSFWSLNFPNILRLYPQIMDSYSDPKHWQHGPDGPYLGTDAHS